VWPTVEAPNTWVKGQRCPKCGGRRGKVIAYNLAERTGQYGTYRYHRFTHRVELKERKTIASGPRKGFQYFAKKRKYCYVPVEDLRVIGLSPVAAGKKTSRDMDHPLSK